MAERELTEHYIASGFTTLEQVDQHNAQAWLALTDIELIERSASLRHPAELHPWAHTMPAEHGAKQATHGQLKSLRAEADAVAREHAGDGFVDKWIEENRSDPTDDDLWSPS